MADWTTISSLATAGGTLVLAVATFASVRSAKRSAMASERALLAGLRPLLVPTRMDDPPQKVGFSDDHWIRIPGGGAILDVTDDVIYMGIALRNAGSGVAILDRWAASPERLMGTADTPVADDMRRLTRDIYIPPNDNGFWQGAIRIQEHDDPLFTPIREAIAARHPITVDILYRDLEGGQRIISRFAVFPRGDDGWLSVVGRHWNLDGDDPR
jgi:hypothetical protein